MFMVIPKSQKEQKHKQIHRKKRLIYLKLLCLKICLFSKTFYRLNSKTKTDLYFIDIKSSQIKRVLMRISDFFAYKFV